MAKPTRPAHPNHKPYDATIAGVVRLLACDASILASAVPMPLIASVTLPLILLLNGFDQRAVYVAETDSDERTVCLRGSARSTQLNVLKESTSSDVQCLSF